jgi:hypothetical protein
MSTNTIRHVAGLREVPHVIWCHARTSERRIGRHDERGGGKHGRTESDAVSRAAHLRARRHIKAATAATAAPTRAPAAISVADADESSVDPGAGLTTVVAGCDGAVVPTGAGVVSTAVVVSTSAVVSVGSGGNGEPTGDSPGIGDAMPADGSGGPSSSGRVRSTDPSTAHRRASLRCPWRSWR